MRARGRHERVLDDTRGELARHDSPGNVAFHGKYPPSRFPRLARILDCDHAPAAEVAGTRIHVRRAAAACDPMPHAIPPCTLPRAVTAAADELQ